ncbi:ATP-dependent RNA helicase HrpA [Streptosporangium sp. 'caverna']|uniref:ATP-dependent RNA helicase HrpA n=1 Tax=Streptosporangium sp. 'caverna' TaxID=2202249 RepID=UPI000D7EB192|nr:ATP-dependent RNA helicase HrpA [Streptosporangium sp. 'caverna']AWS45532.1 ATP-dependent RNA helicase HrpA [Streptosporangium sp. 'caverna']
MGTPPLTSPLADLHARLPELTLRDQGRLRRRLDGARRIRNRAAQQKIAAEITSDIEKAERRVATRRAGVPTVTYPEALPVSQRKDDILEVIRDHQVVIVAGETGSGKTTQLPKICLELGRGVRGLIGHTQPRRIAARTVAERVAEELDTQLGDAVGYKVRFTDQVGAGTLVKVMTDGILLAELQTDRELLQYDTLIIDEAHERSLNIDFILGYLKQLLPRRPDLKIIITSATIDPERFSKHFGDAPIVEVSGRTYPVEVRYRPIAEDDDQIQAIGKAVDELCAQGPGDILVFLSGEREIRDTAEALSKRKDAEILPLYARLSAAEQHRVFQRHSNRRVVLATNVAETSLTVPGIKYVVDPGFARISRYSHRTKVQRLPIEAISQASANQRKGRCGRVSEGICIRLYEEDDFLTRAEFTDPEILRTNLASVILQMTSIGLGDIGAFPFVEPPDQRQVKDGYDLLLELGAFDQARQMTPLGRKLAGLPVDPRLARMVLEADGNGCVSEVMVIASALSIQDPRERPAEKQQVADEKHRRFADKESDFVSYLNLWNYLQEQQKELSSSAFRRLCKAEFLNYLRVREWQDVYGQLRQMAKSLGLTPNSTPGDEQKIHVSLLSGLLSHIGVKDVVEKKATGDGARRPATEPRRPFTEYIGARNARFAIFPGSALAKKQPLWVMSAELVETSRLWARVNAKIEPEWVEPIAQHLIKRTYSEPHWEKKQGSVMAYEKVTLYGVPLVVQRKVNYGRIDPELSRELFIRYALVEGDWETHHAFFAENRKLLEEVEELEERARRRDILVDDETLFDFYDQRVPADVVSGRHFDSWWKKTKADQPDLLSFEKSMLISESAGDVSQRDYPDVWRQGDLRFPLTYQFEPGTDADGVTAHIPLALLNQVNADGFDWQIPGLREELLTALIRALPKPVRRNFVPAPNYAKKVLERAKPTQEPLLAVLERELLNMTGIQVPRETWQPDLVPDHLKITFRVIDGRKQKLAESKDLADLKRRLAPKLRQTLSKASGGLEKSGLTTWNMGALPKTFEQRRMKAYPALADEGATVAVRMFETETEQREAMWVGTRRLLLLNTPSPAKGVLGRLSNQAKLALSRSPHAGAIALFDDCIACAADKLMSEYGGPVWDQSAFTVLHDKVRAELYDTTVDVVTKVEAILKIWHAVSGLLPAARSTPSIEDIRDQVAGLIYPGFVTDTGYKRLPDLLRYLKAAERRLEKISDDPFRDQERMHKVHDLEDDYHELVEKLPPARRTGDDVRQIRWMIEELRVSYFAQTLGTPYSISEKRIRKAMEQL